MADQENIDNPIKAANKINGATIDISKKDDGSYVVKQEGLAHAPPKPAPGDIPFSWSYGPLSLNGTVNTKTFDISVNLTIVGINLGSFRGNLKDGVSISVDLFVVSGKVRFYLKNGNELWIFLQLKVKFDGSFDGDYKIITI